MIKILGIDPSQKNLGLVKAKFAPQDGTLAIIDMKLVSTEKGSDTKQVRKSSDNLRRAQEQATVLREWEQWADIVMSEGAAKVENPRLIWIFLTSGSVSEHGNALTKSWLRLLGQPFS